MVRAPDVCDYHVRAQLIEPAAVALGLSADDRLGVLTPLRVPFPRALTLKESGKYEIPEVPHLAKLRLRFVPQVAQLLVVDALVRLAPDLLEMLEETTDHA